MLDDNDVDEIDGESTAILNVGGRGVIVRRKDFEPGTNLMPAGFYPQWPSFYPDVMEFDTLFVCSRSREFHVKMKFLEKT